MHFYHIPGNDDELEKIICNEIAYASNRVSKNDKKWRILKRDH